MPPRRGLYCLANDRVAGWLGPLLASVRDHEPALPVCLIPFDGHTRELHRLAAVYAADVFADDDVLAELDGLGAAIWPGRAGSIGTFRKFAAFAGPLDEFLFLDADVVVLEPFAHLIEGSIRAGVDLLYFDADMDFVYRPGKFRERMEHEFGAAGISSGSFVSSTAAFEFSALRELIQEAGRYRDEFPVWGEQSVLNYCVDAGRRSHQRAAELFPNVAWSCYAGSPWLRVVEPGPRAQDRDMDRWAPFLHWAGYRPGRRMPHYDVFLKYKRRNRARYGRLGLGARWRRFVPLSR